MAISDNTLAVLLDAPQPNMLPDEFNQKAFAFAAILYTLGIEMNSTAAALNLNATNSTSSDSMAIGTGTKNFEVEPNKSYTLGMSVRIAADIDPTNWMNGDLIAYDPLTGNISVQVTTTQGSGTYTAWSISQSFGGLTSGSVDTDKLADLAVTTAKLADGAVGLEQLAAAVIEKLGASVGDIKSITGDYDPVLHADWLVIPTAATTLSRTTYDKLFARWGVKYGAGDGSTTFGMYFIPANYAQVQSSGGNHGSNTVGEVIAHVHDGAVQLFAGGGQGAAGSPNFIQRINTGSTGGAANLPAGSRTIFLVKFR